MHSSSRWRLIHSCTNVPGVAKVTQFHSPIDSWDLHNPIRSSTAFQSDIDKWCLAQMICPFTCDISHDSCLLKYCGWWNFTLCAYTESRDMCLFSQLEKAPEVGAKGGYFVLEAHFFYRNRKYRDSNIRLWFCHKSTEKDAVLCSGTISWVSPESSAPCFTELELSSSILITF